MKLSLRCLGGAVAAVLMAAPVTAVVPTLVAAPAHADAVDCGCPDTELGAYVRPSVPIAPTGTTAHYVVRTDGSGSEARQVVHSRLDDAALMTLPVHTTSYGFGPDPDLLVVQQAGDAVTTVQVYDLAAADPGRALVDEDVMGTGGTAGFDASGHKLAYEWDAGDGDVGLLLADLDASAESVAYAGILHETGQGDATAGWGFSPDASTFALSYVDRSAERYMRLFSFAASDAVLDYPVGATGRWWFSPCGAYLALTQPDAEGTLAMLRHGDSGRLASSEYLRGATGATFQATATAHVARAVGGAAGTVPLGVNEVDPACVPAPPTGGGSGTPSDPGTPTPTTDPTPTPSPTTDPTPKPPTHLSVPLAPRVLGVKRHGHRITLSWPPVAGATGYVVQIAKLGGVWRSAGARFKTPKGWHQVRIRLAAVNAAGRGAWSRVRTLHL